MSLRSLALAASLLAAAPAAAQTAKVFLPPARTEWRPDGCRTPDPSHPTLASRDAWRSLHSDEVNTDEVAVAYAPVFAADWVAEPSTWNPTGPVFDRPGNLYFVPFQPWESVALVSVDAATGARRWSVPNDTGTSVGSGTPLVLDDPDSPGGEIVYVGRYDRALAVRTDGSVIWEMPTGLVGPPVGGAFGINYHPGADALVGLTRDGFVYAVDRRTGTVALDAPYQLPGEPSPPGPPLTAPPSVQACAEDLFAQFANLDGRPISEAVDVLLGNGVEVANFFSIDPVTGRLWVAATSPDAEDGTVDGVSQLGALYGLDLVPSGPGWTVQEACHASFAGGSASTPALRHDGARVYVGDNIGTLFAIDHDCNVAWTVSVGSQITGSIGVASDNGEIYASTGGTIHQVIDHGTTATIGWSANLDVYDLPAGQIVTNQTIAGIGANAISFQAGAAIQVGTTRLTLTTGVGLLDRLTGTVRWFAPGLEESVAVMSTGPDGALYMGNSPLRRLFSYCLAQIGFITAPVDPPIGGIRKWAPEQPELELRDAVCAAADRARNASRNRKRCPDSVAADRVQLATLVAQSRRATANASGALDAKTTSRLGHFFDRADEKLAAGKVPKGPTASACRRVERFLGK